MLRCGWQLSCAIAICTSLDPSHDCRWPLLCAWWIFKRSYAFTEAALELVASLVQMTVLYSSKSSCVHIDNWWETRKLVRSQNLSLVSIQHLCQWLHQDPLMWMYFFLHHTLAYLLYWYADNLAPVAAWGRIWWSVAQCGVEESVCGSIGASLFCEAVADSLVKVL